jgi:hypothetical protein
VITSETAVLDDLELFHRVPPNMIVWDLNEHRYRPTTGLFRKRERVSVYLEDKLTEESREPVSVLAGYPDHSLAASIVRTVRRESQEVVRSPTDAEPAHGDVVGKKSTTCAERIALATSWTSLDFDAIPEKEKAKEAADAEAPPR